MALISGIVNGFPRFYLFFVSHFCHVTRHRVRWTCSLTKPGCWLPCSEGKGLTETFEYVRPGCWWVLEKMAAGFYREEDERVR